MFFFIFPPHGQSADDSLFLGRYFIFLMASIILEIIHFFITVFLMYLVPIMIFGYGTYIFFSRGDYWTAAGFFVGTVIFFLMFLFRRRALSEKKIVWLKAHGQKKMTVFKRVDRRWNTSINGESPMVVYSEGEGRLFCSEDIWPDDGGPFYLKDATSRALQTLQSRSSNEKYLIPVYINPKKSKEYYMDLGGLQIE